MIRLQCGELTSYVGDLVLSGAGPDGEPNSLGCALVDKGHNDLYDESFTAEELKVGGLTVTSAVNLFKFAFNGDLWLLVAPSEAHAWKLIEEQAMSRKWDVAEYRKRWRLVETFDVSKPGIHMFWEDRSMDN